MNKKNKDFISLELLRKLFTEMKEFKIKKLVVKDNETTYEIEREDGQNTRTVNSEPVTTTQPETTDNTKEAPISEDFFTVKTPFVGTFYRSASPDAEPFADIGKKVKKGDALCIVEAMKTMNEIEAEVSGVVKEILVENGSPVEYDQTLFVIDEE